MIDFRRREKIILYKGSDVGEYFKSQGKVNSNERVFLRIIPENVNEVQFSKEIKELSEGCREIGFNVIFQTTSMKIESDVELLTILKSYAQKNIFGKVDNIEDENKSNRYLESKNSYLTNQNFKEALKEIVAIFSSDNPNSNDTMKLNFVVKILAWMISWEKELGLNENYKFGSSKVIFLGELKLHEYYFLLALFKLGVDVIYANIKNDIEGLSQTVRQNTTFSNKMIEKIELVSKLNNNLSKVESNAEKTTAELMVHAQSVVMIRVYDSVNRVVGSGSGVVLNNEGHIITNFHVVANGEHFGVTFENDETEYTSNQIIKCHQEYDLAIIGVRKDTIPISIEKEMPIRGEKVITIGSPLGFFNSVSEGIVSGFRNFSGVDYIQMSAPISSGSSGGALLNLKGNLIGITTMSFKDAQNFNLAVDRKHVLEFAGNFIKSS